MTTLSVRSASPAKTRSDAVVVGVLQDDKGPSLAAGAEDVSAAYGRRLRPMLANLGVTGKAGELMKIPTGGTLTTGLLVLVGLGKRVDDTALRRAAGVAARGITNATSVALALPASTPEDITAVCEGWLLGGYRFTEYKARDKKSSSPPSDVLVLSSKARSQDVTEACDRAQVLARAVAGTRDWVNTPPGDLRPPDFAAAVRDLHKEATKGRGAPELTVAVHDRAALEELGCGGIIGVGRASSAEPCLVELSYQPSKPVAHLALVGKGITFDSGGLSIKPAQGMGTMKMDMAGAAAVLRATFAIAELGLPVQVSTFAPMAENMLSGEATRPGDVLSMYDGQTVEVLNTDAEGRLILADALARAVETEPDLIVDVATLTGAMMVALGDRVAGVMGSDTETVDRVVTAGTGAGEALWGLPLPAEMKERVHSSRIADLAQHDWGKWGGGLYAGAFLREFTDGRPWAHIDIAGPAFNTGGAYGHVTSGGTGFAVATLVALAESMAGSGAQSGESEESAG